MPDSLNDTEMWSLTQTTDITATMLTVSALNRLARTTLETCVPLLRVSGEVSNLTYASSGHIYFTLKDAQAQVRCTMWRNRAHLLSFRLQNGMQVEARALMTLYEVRGDFQLSIEQLARSGSGNLFEAFLQLKEKLDREGLFDAGRKRPLPHFPARIGIVTSPTAAAFQDVLAALRRRAPQLEIILYPSQVQGQSAAQQLVKMLETAAKRTKRDNIDTLLLVRGGGSLEDLYAFNDEALARAIRACPVPVISGVGHETDFTIADFAADLRAATPTAAAELVSAGYHEAGMRLEQLARSLSSRLTARLATLAQRLDRAGLRLAHPRDKLQRGWNNVQNLQQRLDTATGHQLDHHQHRLNRASLRFAALRPELKHYAGQGERLGNTLARAMHRYLQIRCERLDTLDSHLNHLAPQAVLARGYSIVRDAEGRILRQANAVDAGDRITVQLAEGQLDATINKQ